MACWSNIDFCNDVDVRLQVFIHFKCACHYVFLLNLSHQNIYYPVNSIAIQLKKVQGMTFNESINHVLEFTHITGKKKCFTVRRFYFINSKMIACLMTNTYFDIHSKNLQNR